MIVVFVSQGVRVLFALNTARRRAVLWQNPPVREFEVALHRLTGKARSGVL